MVGGKKGNSEKRGKKRKKRREKEPRVDNMAHGTIYETYSYGKCKRLNRVKSEQLHTPKANGSLAAFGGNPGQD